ncbi:MAG: hypothetical protein HQ481_04465 [Alphaproteobacteria bacterium]|nr:hypothetical protein [Alphaproteobacteria bacterium]
MSEPRKPIDDTSERQTGRRLDVVVYLSFALLIVGAVAVFPLVVDAHRLSGLWISFCAAIGIN